ncbi:dihydroorotate oxidase A [Salinibacterium amurskyense]|uniref:Dihydroorotate dehydrogenase (quinone) n=1 Tax=Salinibacterium amurskyense TaxID=205941 RepID=A0A2M9DAG3_9MICO|nr:quinone-dependent dihydroorotate dehydrogenase [Salinibacterium amurskyense]PJJ82483.1 dihydroorotate oxidase A [Salinibacterium amurskyense]RLQ82228.1 quinone-dependent dihydroorotate dehydrogenase [Salinibacterium amurskyense]GHD76791.1 dihydroorotate dehydrogenase (quinone) [Salinibacterium amurskyense]
MYDIFFRTVLKRLDPEFAHSLAFSVIRALPVVGVGKLLQRPVDPSLRVETLGLTFDSPFGVAAGFDKSGVGIQGLGQLGFSHVEVGTITALPQPGNPKPRLFRLVADRGVINRMGFNNAGAIRAAHVIERARRRAGRPIIGVNIGKSRVVAVDDAVADYLTSARALAPLADYLVVNVSSPNTPGLRGLQEIDKLKPLLTAVKSAAGQTPVLVKIAPDVTDDEARAIARLAVDELDGIIATNTTLSREGLSTPAETVAAAGAGGVSGKPVAARSLELLRIIRAVVPSEFCVISVGGVETAEDVAERLREGATLVQGYTGFIYRGPFWARSINSKLAKLTRSEGA